MATRHSQVFNLLLKWHYQQQAYLGIHVVVQLYPWFKFSFLFFLGMIMYDNNMIISLKQKKRNLNQG